MHLRKITQAVVRKGRSHAIKPGREGCLESQRSLCQNVVQTVPGLSGVAGGRLFQLPVAGPGSLWSKSDAETEFVPRDDAESEKRPSAKSPPSPHPISKPPATAEDTPSNGEPGHPHRPPPVHPWGVNWLILGRDRAASSLLPTPSQRGHLAPPRAPLPQLASPLYRQDPTSVKHNHPLASIIIGEKK